MVIFSKKNAGKLTEKGTPSKESNSIFRSKRNANKSSKRVDNAWEKTQEDDLPKMPMSTLQRRSSSVYSGSGPNSRIQTPKRRTLELSNLGHGIVLQGDAASSESADSSGIDNNDYFSPPGGLSHPYQSPHLRNSKIMTAASERGFANTTYSDSGYESAETRSALRALVANEHHNTDDRDRRLDSDAQSIKSTVSNQTAPLFTRRGMVSVSPMPALRRSRSGQDTALPPLNEATPPVSILAGYKVNTKGKILDEEGDVIGELYEGDLLDCVRQKANPYGEVLDDYGRVVGRVRTVHRFAPSSPGYATPPVAFERGRDSTTISPLLLATSKDTPHFPNESMKPASVPSSPGETIRVRAVERSSMSSQGPPSDSISPIEAEVSPDERKPAASEIPKPPIPTRRRPGPTPTSSVIIEPDTTTVSPVQGTLQERLQAARRLVNECNSSSYQRSQSRLSINSVLINNSKQQDDTRSIKSPSLFSYRGDIPAYDGPPPGSPGFRPQGGSMHPSRNLPPALNVKIAHISGASSGGQRRVQVTDDLLGMPLTRPSMGGKRLSTHSNMKRSPLSSLEVTPNESPDGTDRSVSDDGRSPIAPFTPSTSFSPASSIYGGRSAHTSNSGSRTYFSHAGKVTVHPTGIAESNVPPVNIEPVAVKQEKVSGKKKSRFGLFSKKASA